MRVFVCVTILTCGMDSPVPGGGVPPCDTPLSLDLASGEPSPLSELLGMRDMGGCCCEPLLLAAPPWLGGLGCPRKLGEDEPGRAKNAASS